MFQEYQTFQGVGVDGCQTVRPKTQSGQFLETVKGARFYFLNVVFIQIEAFQIVKAIECAWLYVSQTVVPHADPDAILQMCERVVLYPVDAVPVQGHVCGVSGNVARYHVMTHVFAVIEVLTHRSRHNQ